MFHKPETRSVKMTSHVHTACVQKDLVGVASGRNDIIS